MIQKLAAVLFLVLVVFFAGQLRAEDKTSAKFVGAKTCMPCHKSEKTGKQFDIWQKSKHAEAYKSLATDKANEIAKSKGSSKPATETPECLACHTITADAKMAEKNFEAKDGVQCESCHGAGSGYKTMTIMKDKAKSIAAGMAEYKDDAAIEKKCRTCHNEKSPTFKEFKFKEMWAKIKHPVPKKS